MKVDRAAPDTFPRNEQQALRLPSHPIARCHPVVRAPLRRVYEIPSHLATLVWSVIKSLSRQAKVAAGYRYPQSMLAKQPRFRQHLQVQTYP